MENKYLLPCLENPIIDLLLSQLASVSNFI
jgi:hypothetical protein